MTQHTQSITIHGMHCTGCETVIENAVIQLPGIDEVNADFTRDSVIIRYDDRLISIAEISACIENSGYQADLETAPHSQNSSLNAASESRDHFDLRIALRKSIAVILALMGIVFILWLDNWLMDYTDLPKLDRNISYGLLTLIGFLTSFHCVGMCGPLIISYAAKSATGGYKSYSSHFLYGFGKTLSYTCIGALFGAFGSVIAFTPFTQGAVGIAAGVFLILFSLHMLEVFPELNHFRIKVPAIVMRLIGKEYRKHSNPFIIGLMNGLMVICGPLQAMYVMAAGTGNWIDGAAALFFFGIGTLPILFSFGFLTSLLSTNLTPKLLKASGVIVMILGAIMLNRGLAVTGTGVDFNTLVARLSQKLSPTAAEIPANDIEQTINMDVLKSSFSPNQFTLRKGVPVKWVINGKELNACNKIIVVPQYKLKIELKEGLQTIQFTPPETGVVPWSCWMGMIPGTFIVVDSEPVPKQGSTAETKPTEPELPDTKIYQPLLQQLKHLWQLITSFYQDR
ncbi:MAG: urease accessory protein UreH domain-containing protein [Gammaproteobacteria bacterium]